MRQEEVMPETPTITPKESEILNLLQHGLSDKEIAARLGKSHQTVRNQLRTVYLKLGVHNRTQATAAVLKNASTSVLVHSRHCA
jgi:DNA-binding NarL/FixJ family response regulator